jgi:hypothetical protein
MSIPVTVVMATKAHWITVAIAFDAEYRVTA